MPDPSVPFDYERVSVKWGKVVLTKGSWKNALTTASGVSVIPLLMCIVKLTLGTKFKVPRFTVYRTICERLETANHIMDAIECFHEMVNELAQEIQGKGAKWVLGEYRAHEADDLSVTVLC
jgi:hypothetical protein